MKKIAVIMAGGSGTRFWPKSSSKHPKQFLKLTDPKKSLIQMTHQRLSRVTKDIWVITTEKLATKTKKELGAKVKILKEPVGKNTMAACCWTAWTAFKDDPESVVGIFPADAHVSNTNEFFRIVDRAYTLASSTDQIVCIGIVPTSPSTRFGYIQSKGEKIERFVEKPNAETAQQFLDQGGFYWNAGIFVFKAKVFVEETRRLAPEFASLFDTQKIQKIYKSAPSVPVDIALMEKTNRGAVLPGDFGWNDVGSWSALPEVINPNVGTNLVSAPKSFVEIQSERNIVESLGKKLICFAGIQDCIFVETENVILVAHKSKSEEIKDLVAKLKTDKKHKSVL